MAYDYRKKLKEKQDKDNKNENKKDDSKSSSSSSNLSYSEFRKRLENNRPAEEAKPKGYSSVGEAELDSQFKNLKSVNNVNDYISSEYMSSPEAKTRLMALQQMINAEKRQNLDVLNSSSLKNNTSAKSTVSSVNKQLDDAFETARQTGKYWNAMGGKNKEEYKQNQDYINTQSQVMDYVGEDNMTYKGLMEAREKLQAESDLARKNSGVQTQTDEIDSQITELKSQLQQAMQYGDGSGFAIETIQGKIKQLEDEKAKLRSESSTDIDKSIEWIDNYAYSYKTAEDLDEDLESIDKQIKEIEKELATTSERGSLAQNDLYNSLENLKYQQQELMTEYVSLKNRDKEKAALSDPNLSANAEYKKPAVPEYNINSISPVVDEGTQIYMAINEKKTLPSYQNLANITDDEKKVFNSIYNTEGSEAAFNWYDNYLTYILDQRDYDKVVAETQQAATENPVGTSIASVPLNLASAAGYVDVGFQNLARNVARTFGTDGQYKPINYSDPLMTNTYGRANTTRGTVAQNIDEYMGSEGWGDFYMNAMSVGDSLATMGIGAALGAAPAISSTAASWLSTSVLGGTAATAALKDAKERGLDDAQAYAIATLKGISETVFEHFSIENLKVMSTEKVAATVEQIIKNYAKQGFVEGTEEVFTEIANMLSEAIVLADDSEYNQSVQAYIKQGYTEEEARKKASADAIDNVIEAFKGGLTSALMMAPGATVASHIGYTVAGRNVTESNSSKDVLNDALEILPEGEKRDFVQSLVDDPSKQTDANLGKATAIYQEELKSQKAEAEKNGETYDRESVLSFSNTMQRSQESANETLSQRDELTSLAETAVEQENSTPAELTPSEQGKVKREQKAVKERTTASDEVLVKSSKTKTTITKGIAAVEEDNGTRKIKVKTADGELVNVSDVKFSNESTAELYAIAEKNINDSETNWDEQVADTYIQNYSGNSSVKAYTNAFNFAMNYSYWGISETSNEELKNRVARNTKVLTNAEFSAAYSLGVKLREAEQASVSGDLASRQSAINTAKKTKSTKATGTLTENKSQNGLVYEADEVGGENYKNTWLSQNGISEEHGNNENVVKRFNEYVSRVQQNIRNNKKDVEAIKALKKIFPDLNIEIVDEVFEKNGAYNRRTNTLTVSLGADNALRYVLGHELTHYIQKYSPALYDELRQYVINSMSKDDLYEAANRIMERNKSLSRQEAIDEVVADECSRFFDIDSVKAIQELAKTNRTLAQKIRDFIAELIEKLTSFFKESDNAFNTHALDNLNALKAMYDNALADAVKTNAKLGRSLTEVSTDVESVEEVVQDSFKSFGEALGFDVILTEGGELAERAWYYAGKKVTEVTINDVKKSPVGAMIKYAWDSGTITEDQAKKQYKLFKDVANMALDTGDWAMSMRLIGASIFTAMKKNSDKQYGLSYDFDSICRKTQDVIDATSAKMKQLKRGLTKAEITKIYQKTFQNGLPVPCPECYVYTHWVGIGGLFDSMYKYQNAFKDMDPADVYKGYLEARDIIQEYADKKHKRFGEAKSDLKGKKGIFVDAYTWIEKVYFGGKGQMPVDGKKGLMNPNAIVPDDILFDINASGKFAGNYKEAWTFRMSQGQGYGKAIVPYAEAVLGEGIMIIKSDNTISKKIKGERITNPFLDSNGELTKKALDIIEIAADKQKAQNFLGGQRFQSTSDARLESASDYLIAALEMQTLGSTVQAYTKVAGAVPAFAAWGFSINQSLMPKGSGLDADGNIIDTDIGGINQNYQEENRQNFDSAGNITIGVNDAHIRALMNDGITKIGKKLVKLVRDFIIPYHSSGGDSALIAEFRRIQDLDAGSAKSTDYTKTQNDKIIPDSLLKKMGKTDAEIQTIHKYREQRIAILTGRLGDVDVNFIKNDKILYNLYKEFKGGRWSGVAINEEIIEEQIFPNEYWDRTVDYEHSGENTQRYLDYCKNLGFLHRFSGRIIEKNKKTKEYEFSTMAAYDENGNRFEYTDLAYKPGSDTEIEPFFWKLLVDRRMYGRNGKFLEQKVVNLNDTTKEIVEHFAEPKEGERISTKEKSEKNIQDVLAMQFSLKNDPNAEFAISIYSKGVNWLEKILDGTKSIETRTSNVFKNLIGKRIALVETGIAKRGIVKGYATIDSAIEYNSADEFYKDQDKHLVTNEDDYSFENSNTGKKWGYVLTDVEKLEESKWYTIASNGQGIRRAVYDDEQLQFSLKEDLSNPETVQIFSDERKESEYWLLEGQKYFDAKMNLYSKYQQGIADKNTFYKNTIAVFDSVSRRPRRKPDHTSYSRGKVSSEYWYTEEGVIRGSNHWGLGIKSCDWKLQGVSLPRNSDKPKLTSKLYGFCKWEDFVYKADIENAEKDENGYYTVFDNASLTSFDTEKAKHEEYIKTLRDWFSDVQYSLKESSSLIKGTEADRQKAYATTDTFLHSVAERLTQFNSDYDFWDYFDAYGDFDEAVNETYNSLLNNKKGEIKGLIGTLEQVVSDIEDLGQDVNGATVSELDDEQMKQEAETLLNAVKSFYDSPVSEKLLEGIRSQKGIKKVADAQYSTKSTQRIADKANSGEMLEKDEFEQYYNVHKLSLRNGADVISDINNILQNGFSKQGGFGVNLAPTSLESDNDTYWWNSYMPKKGDVALLVSNAWTDESGTTFRVKQGYKPKASEVIVFNNDGFNYYETYKRQFDMSIEEKLQAEGYDAKGLQYSTKDSEGNALSKGQTEHFKDSKARDTEGNLLRLYHGTPNAGFTKFKGLVWLTTSKADADSYGGNDYNGGGKLFDPNEDRSYKGKQSTIKDLIDNPNAYTLDDVKKAMTEISYMDGDVLFNELRAQGWSKNDIIKDSIAEFAADSPDVLDTTFTTTSKRGQETTLYENNRTYSVYANVVNPYIVDLKGKAINNLSENGYDSIKYAQENNYDGVILRNTRVGRYGNNGDVVVAFSPEQVKLTSNENPTENEDIRYSIKETFEPGSDVVGELNNTDVVGLDSYDVQYSRKVTDKKKLAELESLGEDQLIHTYKSVIEMPDGGLLAPMASMENGKLGYIGYFGVWQEATENPDIAVLEYKADGSIKWMVKIKKENGKETYVRYNPYEHSSNYVLNDQFSEAYKRPRLIVIECVVPKSESDGAYFAEKAKDPTGWTDWKAGKVATKIKKQKKGFKREVFLSRWIKPVRKLSDDEVAAMYKEYLKGTKGISIPDNVVTPGLKDALIRAGVPVEETNEVKSINYSTKDNRSSREILADAFDTVAETDKEKETLKIYRDSIQELNNVESEIRNCKEEIRELMFQRGKKDTARIKQLSDTVKRLEKSLDRYDSKLLNLQASKPLKDIVARTRKKEQQKMKEDFAMSLTSFRQRLTDKEIKKRLGKMAKDLNDRILKPKNNHYIPVGLMESMFDVLDVFDFTSDRKVSKKNDQLRNLRETYAKLRKDEDYTNRAIYDEELDDKISALYEVVGDTPVRDMTSAQLLETYDIMKGIMTQVRNSVRQIGTEKHLSNEELGVRAIDEVNAALDPWSSFTNSYNNVTMSPLRFFRKLGGYAKNGVLEYLGNQLNEGQRKENDIKMHGYEMFREFFGTKEAKKEFDKFEGKKKEDWINTGLKDEQGNDIMMTRDMRVALYLHSLNEDNMRHVMVGGVLIPDMELYTKGKLADAFSKGKTYRFTPEQISQLFEDLKQNDYDYRYAITVYKFFNEYTKNIVNETSILLNGYKKATVDSYFPINVNKDFLAPNWESVIQNGTIEGAGVLKSRVKSSKPIMLEASSKAVLRQLDTIAKYGGLAIPIRNFQNVFRTNSFTLEGNITSLMQAINQKYGKGALGYINNLMGDLQFGRKNPNSMSQFMAKARGKFAQATLAMNLSVTLKQAASYPTAAAVVGWKSLAKAIAPNTWGGTLNKEVSLDEIAKYTSIMWVRSQGFVNQELGDAVSLNKDWATKVPALMGWIQAMDIRTVRRLWLAAEYYVQDNVDGFADEYKDRNGLTKLEGDDFKMAVAEVYNRIVEETQPNYSVMQRPDILRNTSDLVKSLTMFMTQRLQNYNILVDAVGEYNAMRDRYKKGNPDYTLQDLKNAKKNLNRAIASQVVASGVISAMTFAVSFILHNMKRYKDDDDKLTAQSTLGQMAVDMLNSFAGSFLGGSEVYSIVDNLINGTDYDVVTVPIVEMANDFIRNCLKVGNISASIDEKRREAEENGEEYDDTEDLQSLWQAYANIITSASEFFGVPVNNFKKLAHGAMSWVEDAVNGTFLESDVDRNNNAYYRDMVLALEEGNTAQYERLYNEQLNNLMGTSTAANPDVDADNKIQKGIKTYLQENYPEIKEAAQARLNGDNSVQVQVRQDLEAKGFSDSAVQGAINWWVDKLSAEDEPKEVEEYTVEMFDTGDIERAYESEDESALEDIKDYYLENGYTEEEADEKINKVIARINYDGLEGAYTGDEGDAKSYIEELRNLGKADTSIGQSMSSRFKTDYIDAYMRDDKETMNKIEKYLSGLGLRKKDGSNVFGNDKFKGWVDEYRKGKSGK